MTAPVTAPVTAPDPPRSRQLGPDATVEEVVRGVPLRCYADRPHSVVAVLDAALAVSADDVLLVDGDTGTTTTYDEFARHVQGAADALLARGLQPGDRVAVLARNGLEAAVVIWACARAGLVHVGVPVDSPPARIGALLSLTTPSLLLVQAELAAAVPITSVPVEDAARVLLGRPAPWRHGGALPDQDTTYSLIPTSGTTGHPKAVRVTGRMSGHAAAFYARTFGLTRTDRTAIHLPFAWVSGHITQLLPAMLSGGSVVTMATFSAPQLVSVVTAHRVSWLDVVPSIWELLLRTDSFCLPALSGVRLAVYGGAPAPPGTLERVRDRLPQLRMLDVYALSETCAPITCLPDAEALRRPGSVGRPAPYCELRLVGDGGVDVLRGEPGEVWVRSPAVTPGYWGDAEPCPVDDDGWLRTGDLGRLDGEGYLYVGGRAVDLIIRGGVNIYPAEVERALLATGLLADAAAVGVPSTVTGHNVGAAVVPHPGAHVDRTVLQDAVRETLGAHAVPRPLRTVQELPRNANGKVDRTAVLALLRTPAAVDEAKPSQGGTSALPPSTSPGGLAGGVDRHLR